MDWVVLVGNLSAGLGLGANRRVASLSLRNYDAMVLDKVKSPYRSQQKGEDTCNGQGNHPVTGDIVEKELSLSQCHLGLFLLSYLDKIQLIDSGAKPTFASTKSLISAKFPTHEACLGNLNLFQ